MLLTLAVAGYRSLRDVVLPLDRLTVVTGANGSGKSSLYRSLRLLADVAQGRAVASLASEGGLGSTLWAGPEAFSRAVKAREAPVQGTVRRDRVALKLGFASEDFGYAIDLGLPVITRSAFARDPEVKVEAVWAGPVLRKANTLAERKGAGVTVLKAEGGRETIITSLPPFETMMMHAAEPGGTPELLALRERMRAWRFYDHLRTDRDAPARQPQIGTRTVALAEDGRDFAAAIQTIREIGDADGLDAAIAAAFPGSAVEIAESDGYFRLAMRQEGLLRPLQTAELSDGTLRFLLLVAALLTPRPPPLLVLNEPETSLHPDLVAPLGRLVAAVSRETQVIVVTHNAPLVEALAGEGALVHRLEKSLGETEIAGIDPPRWAWPSRG
ncbi:AAA family ATPase [Acuticoccus kandeliae]|uniref:AAA family ATPase n=1 Tax=Acuticoccus kandeliae TaxID=2073160 RepID=UPI000D3E4BA9|nr:AAA family ATPase [Acuticoccus kandeliae]